ncbi:hypothetical protein [Methanosarcina siciliae]|uniref:hypothetical protein n=1 Tax=Methanosarcina siciliae TaxID=38027 RepID=UPI00064E26D7|nr:hypothetical protein [Methanosarcina siciliae]
MELNFNEHGFADVRLPRGMDKIGQKYVKLSVYCPASNSNTSSDLVNYYPSVNFSQKVGNRWDNISFSVEELETLKAKIDTLLSYLSQVPSSGEAEDGFNEHVGQSGRLEDPLGLSNV